MKSTPLKEHLENRLRELKEERRSLKAQKRRSIKESNDIRFILEKMAVHNDR